jgi:hypothetical protein
VRTCTSKGWDELPSFATWSAEPSSGQSASAAKITTTAATFKDGLTIEDDLDVIYTHEYVGMVGDPEKLRTRLVRWFDAGVNWDDSKAFIFKGIQPPPPSS